MPSNFSRGKNELSEYRIRDILEEYLAIYKKTSTIEINNIEYQLLTENMRAITAETEIEHQLRIDINNIEYQLLNENNRAMTAENELRQRILILENSSTNNISSIQKILNWIYNLTGLNL